MSSRFSESQRYGYGYYGSSGTGNLVKEPLNMFGLEDIAEQDESCIVDSPKAWQDSSYNDYSNHDTSLIRIVDYANHNGLSIRSPTLPTFSLHSRNSSARSHRKHKFTFTTTFHHKIRTALSTPLLTSLGNLIAHSQLTWLLLYFTFNLFLTLSNKSVLNSFPFPYTLTAVHALCSTLGCATLRAHGYFISKRLSFRHEVILAMFSVLYAVNIAVSNISLNLVTVPFHQVVRAITPIFTILISTFLLENRTSNHKVTALIPVIVGVVLATYGDYYFTSWGLVLTLLGTVLAAFKAIYTSILQSATPSTPASPLLLKRVSRLLMLRKFIIPPSLGLHPLDLLMRMSPLAFIQCVVYAQITGELDRLRQYASPSPWYSHHAPHTGGSFVDNSWHASNTTSGPGLNCISGSEFHGIASIGGGGMSLSQLVILMLNGCIAFGLNVVSLTTNGKVGALSMTVAGEALLFQYHVFFRC
ncbi:hypothetical protein K474DRAFT_1657828 [Panus rudis PR-1116 ss-1]|nr:hypothetical protein K474DRAFT_1657828 [Panus rudis PR-1116 ss-1]